LRPCIDADRFLKIKDHLAVSVQHPRFSFLQEYQQGGSLACGSQAKHIMAFSPFSCFEVRIFYLRSFS
jgi:hypothetical protein